jgi:murein DD-endopeptidase MepM/ murein hydrolase activator NlpD
MTTPMTTAPPPLTLRETFGFRDGALRQAWFALRGDPSVPGSKLGPSSLKIFTPRLAVATWRGRRALGRTVPVVNLVNRTPTPVAQGWSVRVTQVSDFRGRGLTYDSHNGTDFAIPPGTIVVPSAPGRVVALRSEYNRGGLKLYVDHGGGLLTSYNHLGRALVAVGDDVVRGQPIALSAYSGLDALLAFPWVAPHVHYGTSLGGVLVDPFAAPGETSLWRTGDNAPVTAAEDAVGDVDRFAASPTPLLPGRVQRLLDALVRSEDRDRFAALRDRDGHERCGAELWVETLVYPTRFAVPDAGALLVDGSPRRPVLDLPFARDDYDGIAFADDVGLRGRRRR